MTTKPKAVGEPVALPKDVLDALRFYAHGHHYEIDDSQQQFDTVSGEPANWMFSEKDDDCTMFEDGGIARAVLAGRSAGFEEPVEPFEGEVFTAISTAPTTGSAPEALQELKNIVNAKRFDHEHFEDDTSFADWVQSRARACIALLAASMGGETS